MEPFDAVIVGAGPAGLTAATYLGRFRRKVLVLDGGPSRADWIPESHNTPGFPQGIGGPTLLARLREQAGLYGAEIRTARAETLNRTEHGFELVLSGEVAISIAARYVLLATGVVDRMPDLVGIETAIRKALVRICPICDAYEAIDRRIAILGDGDLGGREALFMTTYSGRVTLLHLGAASALASRSDLQRGGVEVIDVGLDQVALNQETVDLTLASGMSRRFDCLYLALGCEMQSRLAALWGAAHDESGNLLVNAHQETSIDRLYAAGDVVRGLNQIAVASAEAAIAATDIHRHLRQDA